MKLTEKEKARLLRYIGVRIKKNPLTNKYHWEHYDIFITGNQWYMSDGIEYNTRKQAINAFFERAIQIK